MFVHYFHLQRKYIEKYLMPWFSLESEIMKNSVIRLELLKQWSSSTELWDAWQIRASRMTGAQCVCWDKTIKQIHGSKTGGSLTLWETRDRFIDLLCFPVPSQKQLRFCLPFLHIFWFTFSVHYLSTSFFLIFGGHIFVGSLIPLC